MSYQRRVEFWSEHRLIVGSGGGKMVVRRNEIRIRDIAETFANFCTCWAMMYALACIWPWFNSSGLGFYLWVPLMIFSHNHWSIRWVTHSLFWLGWWGVWFFA